MLEDALVVNNQIYGDPDQRIYRIVFKSPVAKAAEPGQFVKIQVSKSYEPLLRRPISIAKIDKDLEEITLYYRVKGKGTEILSEIKPGEYLSVLGPLGQGFTLPEERELCLAAGGIGIFPLMGVAQAALAKGIKVRLFWGGENSNFLDSAGLSFWRSLGIPICLATMDGSAGRKGLVTDELQEFLEEYSLNEQTSSLSSNREDQKYFTKLHVATCGPRGMMKAVTDLATDLKIPVEVSLEERMACGVGACLGCACTLKTEDAQVKRGKVCKDGPVFKGEEVAWDATY